MDGVARNVGIISRNNNVLAGMLSRLSDGAEPAEPRELRILLQDTGHLARETGELLLSLQSARAREGAPEREQVAFTKLSKDFQGVLKRFQQLAEQSAQQAQAESMEQGTAGGGASSRRGGGAAEERGGWLHGDDDDDPLSEQRGLMASDQQQQQAATRDGAEAMLEREKIISQVEATVGEVREIFGDLAQLVSEQSSHIQHISSAIENTASQASRATDELKAAAKYKSRMRSRACCLYAAGIGAAVVLLTMLMLSRVS